MSLRITSCNNYFKLKGIFNKEDTNVFKSEFENIFDYFSSLTINIEDLESMDSYGASALTNLHEQAITRNRKMSIIGLGCKDLYDHFKSNSAA
jgi:anti-anti-sigma regulatory factor